MAELPQPPDTPLPRRPQFRLGSALAWSVLLCFAFAVMGGLLRANRSGSASDQLPLFVLLSVIAPLGVMIVLDLVLRAVKWSRRRWGG